MPTPRETRRVTSSGVKGRPREGYFGATGGGLWKTVDGGDNVGLYPSLVIDAHDEMYISYYDMANGALRLAHKHVAEMQENRSEKAAKVQESAH